MTHCNAVNKQGGVRRCACTCGWKHGGHVGELISLVSMHVRMEAWWMQVVNYSVPVIIRTNVVRHEGAEVLDVVEAASAAFCRHS